MDAHAIADKKLELRRLVRKQLQSLDPDDKNRRENGLSRHLNSFLEQRFSQASKAILGGFAPLKHEVNWGRDLSKNFSLAFPWFNSQGGEMIFKLCPWGQLQEVIVGGVHFRIPPKDCPDVRPDALIVPGLCFSREGHRLGHGKGFYDRYLENFKGTKIGICFNIQLKEELPVAPHDQKVDFVVTEDGLV